MHLIIHEATILVIINYINCNVVTECLRDAETHLAVCIGSNTEEKRRGRAAVRLQTALVNAQEIGDEKLQVVQLLQDLIDNKQRALDADHKKLSEFVSLWISSGHCYCIERRDYFREFIH